MSAPAGVLARVARRLGLGSNAVIGWVAVLIFLGIWEVCAAVGLIEPLFFSSPSRIVKAYAELIKSGQLWLDMRTSGKVFAAGLGLSVLVGIPFGFVLGWYRSVNALFEPFLNFFNATPRIALLPLFLLWFGVGMGSKVAVVFASALFPVLISSISGIQNLDPALMRAARSFGASDLQLFRTLGLPGALPFLLSGLRLAVAQALTATVVAELVASTSGIGYLIAIAGNTFQTDKVFVGVTLVATIGLILATLLRRVERRFDPWRGTTRT